MAESPSYAVQPAAPVQLSTIAPQLGRLAPSAQVQVFNPQAQQNVEVDTSTMDLVMSLGGAVLNKAVEKRQTEQFLVGAQRVAQGDALKDIIDEQPWYTNIFGPSAEVRGAQTIAQISQVDKYTQNLYADMPRLQTMSQEDIGREVNGKMLNFLTGDAATDAVIQQKMVESSGDFYKAHTKAHYKWTQTTMQQQVAGMMTSSAGAFQAASRQRREGTLSEKDFATLQTRAAQSLIPLAGQSPESYWAAVEEATTAAMADGNHHYAGVVFSSGLLDSAPVEVKTKLLDARVKYEARTREREGFLEFGAAIGELKGRARAGVMSPAQVAQEVGRMNEIFRASTGIEGDLFTRKEFSSALAGNYAALYKKQEKRQEDSSKVQAKLGLQQEALELWRAGAGSNAVWAGHKLEDFNVASYSAIRTDMASGADWATGVVENYNTGAGFVNRMLQNDVQAGMRVAKLEGHPGGALRNTYQLTKAIMDKPGGKAAALAYLGEDDGIRMIKYDSLLQTDMPEEIAFQVAFGQPLQKGRKSTDDDVTSKIDKVVQGQGAGWIGELLGDKPLSPSAQRLITDRIGRNYDLLGNNLTLGDEATIAIAMDVTKQEVDVLGSYAYPKSPDRQPIAALIGADPTATGVFFTEALVEEAGKNGVTIDVPGIDGDLRLAADIATLGPMLAGKRAWDRAWADAPDPTIIRLPDQVDPETGKTYGTLAVTVVSPDGKSTMFRMDSRDLRKKYEQSPKFKE